MAKQKIYHGPEFKWWVKHVLRKKYRIVAKVLQQCAKKYAKTTTKFGIKCPKIFDQDLALDKKNGNTLWADAIPKEIRNIGTTWKNYLKKSVSWKYNLKKDVE